jgi:hypothetical protein
MPTIKFWIRGDDSKPWVEAFTLSSNGNVPGIFKRTPSIELSDLLVAASQNFSSSFQVRFGQFGLQRIMDNFGIAGHNFDDNTDLKPAIFDDSIPALFKKST